jgi:hypothetical protein
MLVRRDLGALRLPCGCENPRDVAAVELMKQ